MTTVASQQSQPAGTRGAIAMILAVSVAATLFLFWLIYVHPASDASGARMAFLPALDAILNGASAVSLLVGFTFIRARRVTAHRRAMITAFVFSSLFLVGYVMHHALHGDILFPAAPDRPFYWALLASHIILATLALPMILVTFFFSLSGRFRQHRKIARWTFPIWLYVSITGVATYVWLRLALSRG